MSKDQRPTAVPTTPQRLRCRLEPTGLSVAGRKKQELTGVVRYLSQKEAETFLSDRPFGSCLLRIENPNSDKTPLIISYKYKTKVFHRPTNIFLRTKVKNDIILCKIDQKNFRFLQNQLFKFLDEVTKFINEFCRNTVHFIERELEDYELEKELTIRKYVIFPSKERIVIAKKTEEHGDTKAKSIEIVINWQDCKFFVVKVGLTSPLTAVSSFNSALLDFLGIRPDHTFLVTSALGYNPRTLEDNVVRGRSYSIVAIREPQPLDTNVRAVGAPGREKMALLSPIDLLLEFTDEFQKERDFPDTVWDALTSIEVSLKTLHSENPTTKAPPDLIKVNAVKMDWIKRKIFRTLINLICHCGKTGFQEGMVQPVEIIRLLLRKNPMACLVFYEDFWRHVECHTDCVGILQSLPQFIDIDHFRQVFVRDAGVSKLLTLYNSVNKFLLGGRSVAPLGRVPSRANIKLPLDLLGVSNNGRKNATQPKDALTSSEQSDPLTGSRETDEMNESADKTNYDSSDERDEEKPSLSSSKHKTKVPALKISTVQKGKKLTQHARSAFHSSLQHDSVAIHPSGFLTPKNYFEATMELQTKSATEEMSILATRLGQTLMASDLTALIQLKQSAEVNTQRKLQRTEVVQQDEEQQENPEKHIRDTPQFKIKLAILQTLSKLSAGPEFRKYAKNPVNMLFLELIMFHKDKDIILRFDDQISPLIYQILQNNADVVEIVHTREWENLTSGMSLERQRNFRRKLDLFLWRLRERVVPLVESGAYEDANLYLKILADYLTHCHTRVIASQTVEVFMELLLTVKRFAFTSDQGFVDPANLKKIETIHLVLRIFDEIALQNRFLPLNDLLLTILMQKSDTWDFVTYYTSQLLSNEKFESKMISLYKNGKTLLREFRIQAIKHYQACVEMIKKQYKAHDQLDELLATDSTKDELLKKFEFLISPKTGLISRFLRDSDQYKNYQLKREILILLHKIFSIKKNPFVSKKLYIDEYIGLCYLQFIKFYCSYALDTPTLDLSYRHLKILIDFAAQMNEKIKMRFFQLHTMDFLVREVNLEYEIKIKRKKYTAQLAKQEQEQKQWHDSFGKKSQTEQEQNGSTTTTHTSAVQSPPPSKTETSTTSNKTAAHFSGSSTNTMTPIQEQNELTSPTAATTEAQKIRRSSSRSRSGSPAKRRPSISRSHRHSQTIERSNIDFNADFDLRVRANSIAVTEHEVSSTWLSQTQPGSRPVVPPLNLKPIEEKRGIRTIDPNAFYRSIKKYGKLRNLGEVRVINQAKDGGHLLRPTSSVLEFGSLRPRAKSLENDKPQINSIERKSLEKIKLSTQSENQMDLSHKSQVAAEPSVSENNKETNLKSGSNFESELTPGRALILEVEKTLNDLSTTPKSEVSESNSDENKREMTTKSSNDKLNFPSTSSSIPIQHSNETNKPPSEVISETVDHHQSKSTTQPFPLNTENEVTEMVAKSVPKQAVDSSDSVISSSTQSKPSSNDHVHEIRPLKLQRNKSVERCIKVSLSPTQSRRRSLQLLPLQLESTEGTNTSESDTIVSREGFSEHDKSDLNDLPKKTHIRPTIPKLSLLVPTSETKLPSQSQDHSQKTTSLTTTTGPTERETSSPKPQPKLKVPILPIGDRQKRLQRVRSLEKPIAPISEQLQPPLKVPPLKLDDNQVLLPSISQQPTKTKVPPLNLTSEPISENQSNTKTTDSPTTSDTSTAVHVKKVLIPKLDLGNNRPISKEDRKAALKQKRSTIANPLFSQNNIKEAIGGGINWEEPPNTATDQKDSEKKEKKQSGSKTTEIKHASKLDPKHRKVSIGTSSEDKDDKDKSSVKSSVGLDYSEDAPRAKSGRRLLTKQKRVHSVADKSSKVHTSFELMEESNVSTFKQHTKDDSEESSSHSQKAKMKRRSSGKRSTEFSSGHEMLKKATRRAIVPALKLQPKHELSEKDTVETPVPSDRFVEEETDKNNNKHRFRLTEIENQINPSDVKMHLLFAKGKQMMEEKEDPNTLVETPDVIQFEESLYQNERCNRKLYADTNVHSAIVLLILTLLLDINGLTLESLYTAQFPMNTIRLNVPFILKLHLNHPSNRVILGPLSKRTRKVNESAFRILKLISTRFFQPYLFKDHVRIGEGAYGQVYAAKLFDQEVAVKLMPVPKSIHDRCVLHDIFTEILILDKWKADERICKLIDYGVDDDNYWIVMKRYRMSLKHWRTQQTKSFEENLPLYLNVFQEILETLKFLGEARVNHFDIKLDNFLIEPIDPSMTDEELIASEGSQPKFKVCLADFGESLVYTGKDGDEGYTVDNRGTEFIKSPEMLTVAYSSNIERASYDRRRKYGANKASDVWSVGCLFYELLTGEFLFYDTDWVRFFIRVTSPNEELITQDKKDMLKNNPHLISFLQWILVRDANYRPTINDCTLRFNYVRKLIFDELQKSKRGEKSENENSQNYGVSVPDDPSTPPSAGRAYLAGHEQSGSTSSSAETLNLNVINQDKKETKDSKEEERGRRKDIGSLSKAKGVKTLAVHSKSKKFSHHTSQKRDDPKGSVRSKSKTRKSGTIKGPSSTKHRPKILQDHFTDPKTIKPIEFDEEEIKYFTMNPTKITSYLFLGLYACTEDKKRLKTKYDITHIVNCTNEPNRWEDHFVYLNINADENTDISQYFAQFFDFVRTAARARGKVLVCSNERKSEAAAFVIAFLMENKKLSFFEAFQHVHKRRYIVQLHPKFQSILSRWGGRMAEDRSEKFSCICGKCTWTLLQPFDKTEKQNPIPCMCSYEDSSECPNIGCKHFVEEMKQQHNWPEQPLQWGTTTRDNVQSINPEYVDEFSPIDLVPIHLRDRITSKKDWKLFKCRTCAFITHAENKTDPNVIAIVTNISVPKSSENTTSTASPAPNSTSTGVNTNLTMISTTTTNTTTVTTTSTSNTTIPVVLTTPPTTNTNISTPRTTSSQNQTTNVCPSQSNAPTTHDSTIATPVTVTSPKDISSPRVRPFIPKLTIVTSPRTEKGDKN